VRLDLALVERGLARSRNQAASLIEANRVLVSGKLGRKASQPVTEDAEIAVLEAVDYVSRAGHKLAKALDQFAEIELVGKIALDVGASTGGFTDVLLRRGVAHVVALDVGHDQMVPELAQNSRVSAIEGFNARDLSPQSLASKLAGSKFESNFGSPNPKFDLVVADLSFISLTMVLEQIKTVAPLADLVLLIKPQFEVGKQSLSANGLVNDHRLRAGAINQVVDEAERLGLGICGLVRSELPGTHGNQEYVLWISPNVLPNKSQWMQQIESVAKGV
jgi:23S rRNA (cytidine1920-2'-O)/16S rRNA (cytidine1409-2'-O)-methyltransferase